MQWGWGLCLPLSNMESCGYLHRIHPPSCVPLRVLWQPFFTGVYTPTTRYQHVLYLANMYSSGGDFQAVLFAYGDEIWLRFHMNKSKSCLRLFMNTSGDLILSAWEWCSLFTAFTEGDTLVVGSDKCTPNVCYIDMKLSIFSWYAKW